MESRSTANLYSPGQIVPNTNSQLTSENGVPLIYTVEGADTVTQSGRETTRLINPLAGEKDMHHAPAN